MRRIGVLATAVAVVVAGALPAAAAKPVTEDVITFNWDGGSLSAVADTSTGTVALSGSAVVMIDCAFGALPVQIDWNGTYAAVFDLHPNGSSGVITVPDYLSADDCPTAPAASGLTLSFDAGGKADDRYHADGTRVIERSGIGAFEIGGLGTFVVTVDATRTISG